MDGQYTRSRRNGEPPHEWWASAKASSKIAVTINENADPDVKTGNSATLLINCEFDGSRGSAR